MIMRLLKAPAKSFNVGRLQFIDFARGIMMALMAWDHVSGFCNLYHQGREDILGRRPVFASLTWFLARFVTHWYAPTFIFLAGTVLALSATRRLCLRYEKFKRQHPDSILQYI